METLVGFCNKNGCPQQFWFGTICVLFIGTADDMQAVLTSPNCLQKSYVYNFFENKNGLFTAPGLFNLTNFLIKMFCLIDILFFYSAYLEGI